MPFLITAIFNWGNFDTVIQVQYHFGTNMLYHIVLPTRYLFTYLIELNSNNDFTKEMKTFYIS